MGLEFFKLIILGYESYTLFPFIFPPTKHQTFSVKKHERINSSKLTMMIMMIMNSKMSEMIFLVKWTFGDMIFHTYYSHFYRSCLFFSYFIFLLPLTSKKIENNSKRFRDRTIYFNKDCLRIKHFLNSCHHPSPSSSDFQFLNSLNGNWILRRWNLPIWFFLYKKLTFAVGIIKSGHIVPIEILLLFRTK